MIVGYVNSNYENVDLNSEPYKMMVSDILDYEWAPVKNGAKITGFKKDIMKRNVDIDILRSGKETSRSLQNRLTDFFETDISKGTPGKLYIDDYYLLCYIYSSSKKNWETNVITTCEYGVISDHPLWIKETAHQFKAKELVASNNKRYAYKYAYRYANGLMNTSIVNDHYTDCNFRMIIYGPIQNPLVYIGGHEYLVKIVLEENEYLEIDSAAETVVKVTAFGERINAFHNRNFAVSVFEPIHPGKQNVGWSGRFDFDLIVYEERSEPKWH